MIEMELSINKGHDIAIINPMSIVNIVDSFIEAQDVKQSSKKLYRRTLKQYFNWVEDLSLIHI